MKTISEVVEYLESAKLDLLELKEEQKGDENILLAAYEGAYEAITGALDFINEKED